MPATTQVTAPPSVYLTTSDGAPDRPLVDGDVDVVVVNWADATGQDRTATPGAARDDLLAMADQATVVDAADAWLRDLVGRPLDGVHPQVGAAVLRDVRWFADSRMHPAVLDDLFAAADRAAAALRPAAAGRPAVYLGFVDETFNEPVSAGEVSVVFVDWSLRRADASLGTVDYFADVETLDDLAFLPELAPLRPGVAAAVLTDLRGFVAAHAPARLRPALLAEVAARLARLS